jgi:hypothetical protein
VTDDELLAALIGTLEQLRQILPDDKTSWDRQDLVRLAVERLWITAGNLAESYRLTKGIPGGVDPWAELAGYRNLLAHALPGDLSTDRVFADSAADVGRLLNEVLTLLH